MDFDGYWIHASASERPPYEIVGKYLFFSDNKDRLIEIARNEILHHGFHRAKVNAEMLGDNQEHVLCLYYRDDSRNAELAERTSRERPTSSASSAQSVMRAQPMSESCGPLI